MEYTVNNELLAPKKAVEELKELSEMVNPLLTLDEFNEILKIYQKASDRIEQETTKAIDEFEKVNDELKNHKVVSIDDKR